MSVEGLNEIMDVAEASKVNDYLCPWDVYLLGNAGGCQVFTGLSAQAVSAATGPAHLLPSAHKAGQQGLWLDRTKDFLPSCRILPWREARGLGLEAAEGRGCF